MEYGIFHFTSASLEVQVKMEYGIFHFNIASTDIRERMEYGIWDIKYKVVGQKMMYLILEGVTLKSPPIDQYNTAVNFNNCFLFFARNTGFLKQFIVQK